MDAPAVGGAPRRSGSSPRSGRVLIVDDEVALGWVMGKVLSDTHRVQITISGKDALGYLLQGQRFDVILCDVSMPTMNGVDFHDEVERCLPAQARRIVFVTGGIAVTRGCAGASRASVFPCWRNRWTCGTCGSWLPAT